MEDINVVTGERKTMGSNICLYDEDEVSDENTNTILQELEDKLYINAFINFHFKVQT